MSKRKAPRPREEEDPLGFAVDDVELGFDSDLGLDSTLARAIADDAPTEFGDQLPDADSPLNQVKFTGNNEADLKAQLNAFQQHAKESLRKEINSFETMFDSEWWCAIVFQSREQKNAFLQALKLDQHGDKYLDGQLLAAAMNIPLPPGPKIANSNKINKTWLEFVDNV